ncbi:MAG: WYL domain-containing protein [Acetobacteraceae bacterium]
MKPLGIVLNGGTWYLVAKVGNEARSYRVANIIEASATAERFARHDAMEPFPVSRCQRSDGDGRRPGP